AEDAKLCLEHGVDGIYVSNHGGRSLDYGASTLEVLPEIVDAVGGKAPILFDSGVRRGTDVLKALALGANAVCLGRVPRWGVRGQTLIGEPPGRIPPVQDLVNAEEFAAIAQRKLDSLTYAEIAGSERSAFERITFRPRLMLDSTKLDLSTDLFGQSLFTPILVGPTSQQKRFHPEGELDMARGSLAGNAIMVVGGHSRFPTHENDRFFA